MQNQNGNSNGHKRHPGGRRPGVTQAIKRAREMVVAQAYARGFRRPEIAMQLGISESQVQRDMQDWRRRHAALDAVEEYDVQEQYAEIFRTAWTTYSQSATTDERLESLRLIVQVADRIAYLHGHSVRDMGSRVQVNADRALVPIDARTLTVSDGLAAYLDRINRDDPRPAGN